MTRTRSCSLAYLDPTDIAVWHLVAKYVRPGWLDEEATLAEVFAYIAHKLAAGEAFMLGDLEREFLFYVEESLDGMLEPHIVGDARCFRSAVEQGIYIARELEYRGIRVYTELRTVVRLVERYGFRLIRMFGNIACMELMLWDAAK